jgi:hypothetical protein
LRRREDNGGGAGLVIEGRDGAAGDALTAGSR